MSWQAYVDTNLVGTGKISRAAILGQQGGVWASSAGYTLSTEEQANLCKIHNDPAAAQANGIHAAGQKFLCIRADDRSVYGKKQARTSLPPLEEIAGALTADGIIVVKTKQAILVAEYGHPTQPGEATKITEASPLRAAPTTRRLRRSDPRLFVRTQELADYLIGVGY
ncbi:profilin, required for normal timing of actin polymerization in response to thermal stress [Rhodotorula sphaerocarpa]